MALEIGAAARAAGETAQVGATGVHNSVGIERQFDEASRSVHGEAAMAAHPLADLHIENPWADAVSHRGEVTGRSSSEGEAEVQHAVQPHAPAANEEPAAAAPAADAHAPAEARAADAEVTLRPPAQLGEDAAIGPKLRELASPERRAQLEGINANIQQKYDLLQDMVRLGSQPGATQEARITGQSAQDALNHIHDAYQGLRESLAKATSSEDAAKAISDYGKHSSMSGGSGAKALMGASTLAVRQRSLGIAQRNLAVGMASLGVGTAVSLGLGINAAVKANSGGSQSTSTGTPAGTPS